MNVEDINLEETPRILFMGTPEFAVPILEGLFEHYEVRAVVTQPDKKQGRDGKIIPSPIKKLAEEHTVLVLQPEDLKDAISEIVSLKINLIVTCAYGQIVPRELLVYPTLGCINVHASLLPKYRGGAPIQRAIMEGEKKTGITIMHMNPYLDEGDIISKREVKIEYTDTYTTLHDKLSKVGKELLLETLPSIIDKTAKREKQEEEKASFAFTIKKEDEKIDFNKTKDVIYNQVRALAETPGAYCMLKGKRMKVYGCLVSNNFFPEKFNGEVTRLYREGIGVKVENGEIVLTDIQPEGKARMKAIQYINGIQNKKEFEGYIFE